MRPKSDKDYIWKEPVWWWEREFVEIIIFISFLIIATLSVLMVSGLAFMLGLIFAFSLIRSLKARQIAVTFKGIYTGNETLGKLIDRLLLILPFLRQKDTFLRWEEIEKIEVTKEVFRISYVEKLVPYVKFFTTKQKQCYGCRVYDTKGFVNSLEKVGKSNLIQDNLASFDN